MPGSQHRDTYLDRHRGQNRREQRAAGRSRFLNVKEPWRLRWL
jgi:hypothetical protein